MEPIKEKYPHFWNRVKFFWIAFASLYLVQRALSAVIALLDKKRNNLKTVRWRDLGLLPFNMKPDINRLMTLH